MVRCVLILSLSVSWLWSQENKVSKDLFDDLKSSQDYFEKSSYYNSQIRKKKSFYSSRDKEVVNQEVQKDLSNNNTKTLNKAIKSVFKKTVNKSQKKEAIGSKEKNNFFSKKTLLSDSKPKEKKNQNILKNSKLSLLNLFEDKIIVGLGFDTDKPLITCKIGHFFNRHLLVGGMFSGSISNEYYPAFAGDYVVDVDDLDGDGDVADWVVAGDHPDYTLYYKKIEFGVFARLYTLNTFFIEVDVTRKVSEDDVWLPATFFDVLSDSFVTENMINTIRRNSTNLGFGIGYPVVWKSTFSFEPFIKFDLILSGKHRDLSYPSQTYKISGSRVVGGVNILFLF